MKLTTVRNISNTYPTKLKNLVPKKALIFSCLIFSAIGYQTLGQAPKSEIHFLLNKAKEENLNDNAVTSMEYGIKALQYAENNNLKEEIAWSKYEVAQSLYLMGRFKESFDILAEIENKHQKIYKKDIELQLKVSELKGKNLWREGIPDLAYTEYVNLQKLSKKIKEQEVRKATELKACILLGALPDYDSSYYYLKKALSYEKTLDSQKEFIIANLFNGNYFLQKQKNLDSAIYFNQKAEEIDQKYKSNFHFLIKLQKAEIATLQNKPEEALKHCFEALETAIDKNRVLEIQTAYKLIADNYRTMKNYQKEAEYMELYSRLTDSLDEKFQRNMKDYFQHYQNLHYEKSSKYKTINIIILIFNILLVIGLIYFALKTYRYKKIKSQIKTIIKEKEKEVEELKSKLIDNSKEDLLYIAQHKPIEFPQRFAETHGDFVQKLLAIEPNLVATEITFCAYLKLKLSTKEIATIMSVTPKAIQNRKNKIRKKLNIPSDVDIYVWFNNL